MNKSPKVEVWHSIYRKGPAGWELTALLRREDDAEAWHANPDLFFNCTRRVRVSPAPIEVVEPMVETDKDQAVLLLDRIVNGPDERLGENIGQAKLLLGKLLLPPAPTQR